MFIKVLFLYDDSGIICINYVLSAYPMRHALWTVHWDIWSLTGKYSHSSPEYRYTCRHCRFYILPGAAHIILLDHKKELYNEKRSIAMCNYCSDIKQTISTIKEITPGKLESVTLFSGCFALLCMPCISTQLKDCWGE